MMERNSDGLDYENGMAVFPDHTYTQETSTDSPTCTGPTEAQSTTLQKEQHAPLSNTSQPRTTSNVSELPEYQNAPKTAVIIRPPQGVVLETDQETTLPSGVNILNKTNAPSARPLPEVTGYESYHAHGQASGVYQELRDTRVTRGSRLLAAVVIVLAIAVVCLIIGLAVVAARRKTPGAATTPLVTYEDCQDAMAKGHTYSGVYTVTIQDKPTRVYCDMTTDGGGWLVFQRRVDGSVDFYRTWLDYKRGFGDLSGNLWLGNDCLHLLTASRDHVLRIDLTDWQAKRRHATYRTFVVASEENQYSITVGDYAGTAGDSLSGHSGSKFSTKDQEHDIASWGNCAVLHSGAWWYSQCLDSNLNGPYRHKNVTEGNGIVWNSWRHLTYSLKNSEMKIRPRST